MLEHSINKTLSEKALIAENILDGDRKFYLLDEMTTRGDILDNQDKADVQDKVNTFTYRSQTGYDAVASKVFNTLGEKLKVINNSNASPQDKVFQIQAEVQKRRANLNYLGRNYTKGNKDKVTLWYNEQIKMIDILEKDSRSMSSGEFTKKYLETLEGNVGLQNKLNLRAGGYNPEAHKAAIELRAFILKEQIVNPDFVPTDEEMKPINDFINSIKRSIRNLVNAASNIELNNFYSSAVPEKLRGINLILGPSLKRNEEVDITAKGYINNLFTLSEIKGAQEGDSSRMNFDDQLFTSLSAMDDNIITHFVTNEADFRQSLQKELQFYKTKTEESLNSIKSQQPDFENQKVPVQFYEGLGIFSVPTNKALNDEIDRVNKYISLVAKSQGVKAKDVAINILNTEFSMFSINGQETKVPVVEPTVVKPEVVEVPDEELSEDDFITKLKKKFGMDTK